MNETIKLPIGDTLSTAWKKTYGAKASLWASFGLMAVVLIVLAVLSSWYEKSAPTLSMGISIIGQIISYLLWMGVFYIGIQRAANLPISYNLMFRALEFNIALRLIGLYLLQIVIFIPFVILSIISIVFLFALTRHTSPALMLTIMLLFYVAINIAAIFIFARLMLAAGFVLERGSNPWQAIKLSFQATKGQVLRLCLLFLLQIIIVVISAIPLFIGLIWTLPFTYILYGAIYKTLSVNIR